MKVTLESTKHTTHLIGDRGQMEARIWEGYTESGIPVVAFITRIQVPIIENSEEFERELEGRSVPSLVVEAIPLRLIL